MAEPLMISTQAAGLDDLARKMRVGQAAGFDECELVLSPAAGRALIAAIDGRPEVRQVPYVVTVEVPARPGRWEGVFWALVLALYLQAVLTPAAGALVRIVAGWWHG